MLQSLEVSWDIGTKYCFLLLFRRLFWCVRINFDRTHLYSWPSLWYSAWFVHTHSIMWITTDNTLTVITIAMVVLDLTEHCSGDGVVWESCDWSCDSVQGGLLVIGESLSGCTLSWGGFVTLGGFPGKLVACWVSLGEFPCINVDWLFLRSDKIVVWCVSLGEFPNE